MRDLTKLGWAKRERERERETSDLYGWVLLQLYNHALFENNLGFYFLLFWRII